MDEYLIVKFDVDILNYTPGLDFKDVYENAKKINFGGIETK